MVEKRGATVEKAQRKQGRSTFNFAAARRFWGRPGNYFRAGPKTLHPVKSASANAAPGKIYWLPRHHLSGALSAPNP
jgi:hypothetical protein